MGFQPYLRHVWVMSVAAAGTYLKLGSRMLFGRHTVCAGVSGFFSILASLYVRVLGFGYPEACVVDQHSLCHHLFGGSASSVDAVLTGPVFVEGFVTVEVLFTALTLVPLTSQIHLSAPSFVEQ